MLIDHTVNMTCVGTFNNCSNVVEEVEQTQPDVVLMDIDMPTVNGIEGLKRIRKHAPNVYVVMQTVFEQNDKIFEAIRCGAHGYFLKSTDSAKLIDGIRDVCDGGAPMTSIVAKKVLHMFHHQNSADTTNHFDLTERELEILSHLVKGLSYKMIADATSITYHTVNWHCKKIYEKLHVHSATEAVAKALHHRIV